MQSLSGLVWLNDNANQPPVPLGLARADIFAGAHLVQGILAHLVRRGITGKGGLVEVTLLESFLYYQFKVLTTPLDDGGKLPQRSTFDNAHACMAAPYGIYETSDDYLAMAMGSIPRLGQLLGCAEALAPYEDPKSWVDKRDEIRRIPAEDLKTKTTGHWLGILERADVRCSNVVTWPKLLEHEGFRVLDIIQEVSRANGASIRTTLCPIRIDDEIYKSKTGAPRAGQHSKDLITEFKLGLTRVC